MMNRVHTGIQSVDGGTEKQGLRTLLVAAVAIVMFVIGSALFYLVSSAPSAKGTTEYSPIVG